MARRRGFGKGGGRARELEEMRRERVEAEQASAADPEAYERVMAWKSPLAIVLYPGQPLRATNLPVREEDFGPELAKLAQEMFEIMYKTDGVGLAAPQVGVNLQLMVYNEEGRPNAGEEVVLCNPRIVQTSKELDYFEEGCLSFPKIYADVKRPISCAVEAQDLTGRRFTMELDGFAARVFQHEFDHLSGTLFIDRFEPLMKLRHRPALEELRAKHGPDGAN
eukprot:CAMPEP_0170134450 /NCGR_PEP_ID=MMETSP0033_2-20121228/1907_1 /TAXON_ID=195969 /ORGANISM="Dolichomastix tenuilepis, Strain CCMP3274" /LENGTH=221 /DNA_ID=CAMNT_0010370003 /DNA_START=183 /DNA_END=848 /DNA_ORIENTATION=-